MRNFQLRTIAFLAFISTIFVESQDVGGFVSHSHDSGGDRNSRSRTRGQPDPDRRPERRTVREFLTMEDVDRHNRGRDVGGFVNVDDNSLMRPRYGCNRRYGCTGWPWRRLRRTRNNLNENDYFLRQVFFLRALRYWQYRAQLLQNGAYLAFVPPFLRPQGRFRFRIRAGYSPGLVLHPSYGRDLNLCTGNLGALCYPTSHFRMEPGKQYAVEISYRPPGSGVGSWTPFVYLTTLEVLSQIRSSQYPGYCEDRDPCWSTLNSHPCNCRVTQQCQFNQNHNDPYRKYCLNVDIHAANEI